MNLKVDIIRRYGRVNHPASLDSVNNLVENENSDNTELDDEFQNKWDQIMDQVDR